MKNLQIILGVILALVIALIGIELSDALGYLMNFKKSPVSSIILAILIGMVLGNLFDLKTVFSPGFDFCIKRVLKIGIICLGIRLSFYDVIKHATVALPLIIVCISFAIGMTYLIGKKLKISQKFALLTAVGTSICGATAIVATSPVINANKEETSYAIANITIFGILVMIIYPYLANVLFETESHIGYFLGTSIHETAQVAGAGLIYHQQFNAPEAFDVATITKLLRNSLMLVVIPLIAYWHHKTEVSSNNGNVKMSIIKLFPLFILGFLLMAVIRTIGDTSISNKGTFLLFNTEQWSTSIKSIKFTAELLLTVAMSAVGLSTNLKSFVKLGIKPFYLGFIVSTIVGVTSFVSIKLLILFGVM